MISKFLEYTYSASSENLNNPILVNVLGTCNQPIEGDDVELGGADDYLEHVEGVRGQGDFDQGQMGDELHHVHQAPHHGH